MKKKTFLFSYSKHEQGFSLVEMIVAMGIFAIVAVVALGALVKIISANKKAQSIQAAVTNMNYALDTITREMRAGIKYYCVPGAFSSATITVGQSCDESSSDNDVYVAFLSSKTVKDPTECRLIYVYKFEKVPDTDRQFKLSKAQQSTCDETDYVFFDMLDDNVNINSYSIKVTSDTFPLATIRISGNAGVREREKTFFDIQTAVSPRVR